MEFVNVSCRGCVEAVMNFIDRRGRVQFELIKSIPPFLVFILALYCSTAVSAPSSTYVNFEGKQTSPIRLSADATRLFVVNTPDARLSVFDVSQPSNPRLMAEIPVGIEPVSVNPVNNDEVWVVNEVSDSISIVSVSQRIVTDTIYVKDEPADVVFADGKAFVSAARRNIIAVFDALTHNLVTNISVFGENPRALTVNTNGTKVYAAFALSGNRTTIVPPNKAPKQSPFTNNPPQVGLIIDATDPNYTPPFTNIIQYFMPDNDVVEIDTASLSISRYFPRVGTINLGLAIQPGSGDLYVANTDARNLVHFEPNVRSHTVDNRVSKISIDTGVVRPIDLNSNINYSILPNLQALTNALAQPTAIVFEPSGSTFYVAAYGSDRVARIADSGAVLARIEIGTAIGSTADPRNKKGPRGLAMNAAAQRLYVANRIANTISIIDMASDSLLNEIPIGSFDPTPASIRNGRGFLYDAKVSGNGTMSCAACHIDAEMDMIAWDLGEPGGEFQTNTATIFGLTTNSPVHPMKGPMTTQTLRGLLNLEPFHWRGDRTNFTHFNVAFPGLMGTTALSSADMNAYRDFINTITYQPNPNQNLDRTYPTNVVGGNAEAGRSAFFFTNYTGQSGPTALRCDSCHTGPPGSGSDRTITPRVALQESQDFKVPQLRATYQKMNFNNAPGTNTIGGFGIVHDGQDPSLQVFLSRNVFVNIRNNNTIKNNLAAFVQCFDTGTAPAVGYSRTLTSTNVTSVTASNDWSLLETQAAALTNIDLIAKGTIDGIRRGLLYQPSSNTYRPDSTNVTALTRSQLADKIQIGDTLTIMGVPPGSGMRMGIDRDLDGVLDADVPGPHLGIALSPGATILHWPFSAVGFDLEFTSDLSLLHWSNNMTPVNIVGPENFVTNPVTGDSTFFRLRSP
jgi:DNA-binding beta-propeller fold protein YncE